MRDRSEVKSCVRPVHPRKESGLVSERCVLFGTGTRRWAKSRKPAAHIETSLFESPAKFRGRTERSGYSIARMAAGKAFTE
jgi:hypothetical protein